MAKKIVEIFTESGEVAKYRPLSQRLPEFLRDHPNHRVEMKITDAAHIQPGLMQLYTEALKAGLNPKEVGLPPLVEGLIFRATLYDPAGKVVANATAHRRRITDYKDLEKGETAARQRLLAALGYAGEVLDEDESSDMSDQGLTLVTQVEKSEEAPVPKPKKTEAPKVEESEASEETETETEEEPSAEEPQPPTAPPADIPPALLRQIEHQAKLKGVTPVPTPKSRDEARKILKDLLSK